jgi:hypothetical protein
VVLGATGGADRALIHELASHRAAIRQTVDAARGDAGSATGSYASASPR